MDSYEISDTTVKACPWGTAKTKLDPKKISGDVKEWLANQVIKHGRPAKEVAARFDMLDNTIRQYVSRLKKNKSLNSSVGPPTLLSPKLQNQLKAELTGQAYKHTPKDMEGYIQEIREAEAKDKRATRT